MRGRDVATRAHAACRRAHESRRRDRARSVSLPTPPLSLGLDEPRCSYPEAACAYLERECVEPPQQQVTDRDERDVLVSGRHLLEAQLDGDHGDDGGGGDEDGGDDGVVAACPSS